MPAKPLKDSSGQNRIWILLKAIRVTNEVMHAIHAIHALFRRCSDVAGTGPHPDRHIYNPTLHAAVCETRAVAADRPKPSKFKCIVEKIATCLCFVKNLPS